MRPIATQIFILAMSFLSLQAEDDSNLPLCSQYEACAVRLSRYPEYGAKVQLTTDPSTSTTTEGSGEEGSGEGYSLGREPTAFPEYDEFVTDVTPFDFQAKPTNVTEKKVCRCKGSSDDGQNTCGFSDPDSIMHIDPTLELSFCKPVSQLFRTKCVGRRGMLRIIGHVHDTGEIIDDVQSTVIFCNCETGFRRVGIEPWINGYAFTYQCNSPWEKKLRR